MAESKIHKDYIITTVTLSYYDSTSLRNTSVDIPNGKTLAHSTIGIIPYNAVGSLVTKIQRIGDNGLIAHGSGFSSGQSLGVQVIWF
jgi:hypothetical protein